MNPFTADWTTGKTPWPAVIKFPLDETVAFIVEILVASAEKRAPLMLTVLPAVAPAGIFTITTPELEAALTVAPASPPVATMPIPLAVPLVSATGKATSTTPAVVVPLTTVRVTSPINSVCPIDVTVLAAEET
jgi:hypothetical protein